MTSSQVVTALPPPTSSDATTPPASVTTAADGAVGADAADAADATDAADAADGPTLAMTSIATDTTAPPPATHAAETQMRGHSVRFNYLIYVYR